jgi:hypothetical protein
MDVEKAAPEGGWPSLRFFWYTVHGLTVHDLTVQPFNRVPEKTVQWDESPLIISVACPAQRH